MKKAFLTILLLFALVIANAQSYIGLLSENYAGVHGVINNPASIADSRFKTDINLVGLSVFAANDFYGFNFMDALDEKYDFEEQAKKSSSTDNNFMVNTDIFGPAFMFNIKKKNTVALFSRARLFLNANELNGVAAERIVNGFDGKTDVKLDEGTVSLGSNSWLEVGASFARVLQNKGPHFIKGGISLKYLKGMANGYVQGENISVDYDADGGLIGTTKVPSVATTGTITYGYTSNIDEDADSNVFAPNASGFGVDLGAVYEWRTDQSLTEAYQNKYKFRLGVSVTDIGAVNYGKGEQKSYNFNKKLNEADFEKIDDINDIEKFYTTNGSGKIEKAILPTAVHLDADYLAVKNVYVNLNTALSLNSNKVNRSRIANRVSLTPRFESKWFSAYMPLSYIQYSAFNWGLGLRAGPLYIGSGSALSALTSNNLKGLDAYAGLKIPLYHNKPKDRDGDGIVNKKDECPDEAGPVENNGCPWPDKDSDEVLDKDDKCPDEAGPAENNGCPWPDTDNDEVLDKDDQCPNKAGDPENNGCPWPDADNDGILDKDDKCPQEQGTVANNGCPEVEEPKVTENVQKTLNEYAKTVLFNYGKSSIKQESTAVLNDILNILKEYPTARFVIEGHTDSSGSQLTNQRLSDSRANSVMQFLIKNGVDPSRLSAIGYGENKPIADNKTKEGRKLNRRVEINLVK